MADRAAEWIKNVVTNLDGEASGELCARVLQSCGRRCAPEKLIAQAKKIFDDSEDIGEFLARFSEIFDALHIEDNAVTVVYPQCYCPNIQSLDKEEIPDIYCECSVGWIREVFEQAIGRPVTVERLETVVAGDAGCRFKITLEASTTGRPEGQAARTAR